MELSKRLMGVTSFVTPGNIVADVGCDHGYVAIHLVKKGLCKKVIAMDVNRGPLEKAKEHIEAAAFSSYIETRLSDGIHALASHEVETLICAGMGGRLMIKILTEGREKVRLMKELILQPQSELEGMRSFLRKEGYLISQENMIEEDGKNYVILKILVNHKETVHNNATNQILYDRYGKYLLEQRNPVLKNQLEQEKIYVLRALQELEDAKELMPRSESRKQELKQRLTVIEKAVASYFDEASEMGDS